MKPTIFVVLALAFAQTAQAGQSPDAHDIAIADFEGETYGDWKTTGDAFGAGPARGTLRGQMPVEGHFNVDQIVQTDRRLPLFLTDAKREIQIEKRYLHLPIKNGAAKRKVTILIDGRVEVKNDIELADATPDWWAFCDAGAWKGKTITLRVDKLAEDSRALRPSSRAIRSKVRRISTANRFAVNSTSRLEGDGTTTRTEWSSIAVSITSSINTIHLVGTGATCTGGMPSVKT